MPAELRRSLFASRLLRVERVHCRRPHRAPGGEERKDRHEIMVSLSGVNVRHVEGKALTVSPSRITLSNRDEPYRVSHPYGSGERALTIALREDLLLDLLAAADPSARERPERPFRRRQVPADARLHLAIQLLLAAIARGEPALELEETVLRLVERILAFRPGPPAGARDRAIAEEARAFLAGHLARAIRLEDVASAQGLSVFHLCRAFRRATGHTLWREVQQLRVRAALGRLAAGERDLSALAVALGFAHHSHFTASVRRELGLPPSAIRRLLETGSAWQVRRLLGA